MTSGYRSARRSLCSAVTLGAMATASGAISAPLAGRLTAIAEQTAPPKIPRVPPGAAKVVGFDWSGQRAAICAEPAGDTVQPADPGIRSTRRTSIWIDLGEGQPVRRIILAPDACDPAWSPDGTRLAAVASDGLWIFENNGNSGRRLVDAPVAKVQTEFAAVTFSKPRWSADGARIAFLATNGGTSWAEVFDILRRARIYKSPPETYDVAWGADSKSLLVAGEIVRLP